MGRGAALLLFVACAAGCAHAPGTSMTTHDDAQVQALLALEQEMFAALRARSPEALRRVLAPDFLLLVPGSPSADREAFIAGVLGIPGEILEVSSDDLQARLVGATGVLTGRQRARVRLPDGKVVDDLGAFTDVCERRDGRWVMVLAHSVPLAPAP